MTDGCCGLKPVHLFFFKYHLWEEGAVREKFILYNSLVLWTPSLLRILMLLEWVKNQNTYWRLTLMDKKDPKMIGGENMHSPRLSKIHPVWMASGLLPASHRSRILVFIFGSRWGWEGKEGSGCGTSVSYLNILGLPSGVCASCSYDSCVGLHQRTVIYFTKCLEDCLGEGGESVFSEKSWGICVRFCVWIFFLSNHLHVEGGGRNSLVYT